jgi:hypothetical protein
MGRHASRFALTATLAALLLCCARTACGAPVTYTFSGNVGGDASSDVLPLTFFTNAAVSVSAQGDTTGIVQPSAGVYCTPVHDVVVVIAGVGTLTPDTPALMVVDSNAGTWGFYSGTCAALDETVIGDSDPLTASYHLDTSIGPSTGNSAFGGSAGQGDGAGEANFDQNLDTLTFQAVVSAAPPPPPAAVAMPTLDPRMLGALALLVAVAAWRFRRSVPRLRR